jgi:hypothetical protein
VRVRPGQNGEAAQPGWVGSDRFGQSVVGAPGEGNDLAGWSELGQRAVGQDLQFDAMLVHLLDPACPDVSA